MSRFKVSVLGVWHLGSVTSACLADLGYCVVGFEPDVKVVEKLNQGIPPLFEPGLEEMIKKNLSAGRLFYTANLEAALKEADFVIVAFDTPVDEQDEADLSPIKRTITQSTPYLKDCCTTIISSQVPVGTCEDFATQISINRPTLRFGLAYVPENLRLGQAIERFIHPDMIVIGANDQSIHERVEGFLGVIGAPILKVDLRTAEMIKHAINTYLAMQISFINEIANLSDNIGADAVMVGEAMRLDGRIGSKAMLKPGLGFAGGTLARDLKVLQKLGKNVGYNTHVIDSILTVNRNQNRMITARLRNFYNSINGLTVGILGLTYKPGTSTLRRSASLEIIHELVKDGVKIKAYDPKADIREIPGPMEFEFCQDIETVAKDTDALIFVTAWPEFRELDFSKVKSIVRRPVIIDAQNILNAENIVGLGYVYLGVGRGKKAIGKDRKE